MFHTLVLHHCCIATTAVSRLINLSEPQFPCLLSGMTLIVVNPPILEVWRGLIFRSGSWLILRASQRPFRYQPFLNVRVSVQVLQHSLFFFFFFGGTGMEPGPCECRADAQEVPPPQPQSVIFLNRSQCSNCSFETWAQPRSISWWELSSDLVLSGGRSWFWATVSQHAEVHPGSWCSGFLQPRLMLPGPKGRTSIITRTRLWGFPSSAALGVTSGNFSHHLKEVGGALWSGMEQE